MVLWPFGWIEIKQSSLCLHYSSKYNAPTALGLEQEVEQTMANVFHLF